MTADRGPTVDPDFSREVLEDLYAYPRKRKRTAWIAWAVFGWLGAHRFYLQRELTGLLMLFTGGGGLLWWLADGVLLSRMVETHNRKQEMRERSGLPPLEMDFMPPLHQEALARTPEWVDRWRQRSAGRRRLRLAADVLVLMLAGFALGTLVGMEGALEAIVAVVFLAALTSLGAGPGWLDEVPGFATLERWAHRLRLFYFHNEPGSPPALLLRSVIGVMWAPIRARARIEVKLYVEVGAAFTAAFLALDVVFDVLVPTVSGAPPELVPILVGWLQEALVTFGLTYAFAAPVGAILTLHLLVRSTHVLPRILAAVALLSVGAGVVGGL